MVFLCELCICVGCVLLVCVAWVFVSGCGAFVVCVFGCVLLVYVWGGCVCVGCAYVCGVRVFCVVNVRWVCVFVCGWGVCALGVRVRFAFLCVVCAV